MCILCVLLTVLYFTGNGRTQGKGCGKKCMQQSRKVLWVVLSSLFFEKKLKISTSDHVCMFGSAKSPKRKQQK